MRLELATGLVMLAIAAVISWLASNLVRVFGRKADKPRVRDCLDRRAAEHYQKGLEEPRPEFAEAHFESARAISRYASRQRGHGAETSGWDVLVAIGLAVAALIAAGILGIDTSGD